jgi:hypothetical protein
MSLQELNTANVNFIRPYFDTVMLREYCYRDEVAHPRKLMQLCANTSALQWDIFIHEGRPFFSTIMPWDASYSTYGHNVTALYIRVLTRTPSMFTQFATTPSLSSWFDTYGTEAFLVSHVILEDS